jgi:hypothetical protein
VDFHGGTDDRICDVFIEELGQCVFSSTTDLHGLFNPDLPIRVIPKRSDEICGFNSFIRVIRNHPTSPSLFYAS